MAQSRVSFVNAVKIAMVDNSRYPILAGQPMPSSMRDEMENSMERLASPIYTLVESFILDPFTIEPTYMTRMNLNDPLPGYLGDKIDDETIKYDPATLKLYVNSIPEATNIVAGGVKVGTTTGSILYMLNGEILARVQTNRALSSSDNEVPSSRAVKLYVDNAILGIGGGSGLGDMIKSTYDVNNNGVVDDSSRLNNELPAYYLTWGNFLNVPTTLAGYGITDNIVIASGTPVANQIAIWNSQNTIQGNANLTWNGLKLTVKNATGGGVLQTEANGGFYNPSLEVKATGPNSYAAIDFYGGPGIIKQGSASTYFQFGQYDSHLSGKAFFYQMAAQSIGFFTAATERLLILGTGNVQVKSTLQVDHIGEYSATHGIEFSSQIKSLFHIYHLTSPQLRIQAPSGVDGDVAGILFGVTTALDYQQAGIFAERMAGGGELNLHFATKNGAAGNATKANARMTITYDGYIDALVPIRVDHIAEKTAAHGVQIDSKFWVGEPSAAIKGYTQAIFTNTTAGASGFGMAAVFAAKWTGGLADFLIADGTYGYRPRGNISFQSDAILTHATQNNIGAMCLAGLSTGRNIGAWYSSTMERVNAINIGIASYGYNGAAGGIAIGGFFGLANTGTPTWNETAALITDNGSTTGQILIARDNGVNTFWIADGGVISSTGRLLIDHIGEYTTSNGIIFDNPIHIIGLTEKTTETNVIYYNPSTGKLSYGVPATGGISLTGSTDYGITTRENSTTINAQANLTFDSATLRQTAVTASNTIRDFIQYYSSIAAPDVGLGLRSVWYLPNTALVNKEAMSFSVEWINATSTTEDSRILFKGIVAGTVSTFLDYNAGDLRLQANDNISFTVGSGNLVSYVSGGTTYISFLVTSRDISFRGAAGTIHGGDNSSGTAYNITVRGGYSTTAAGNGGSLLLSGGPAYNGIGGNVYIYGGTGSTSSGLIYFGTGSAGYLPARTSEVDIVYYDPTTGKLSHGASGSGIGYTEMTFMEDVVVSGTTQSIELIPSDSTSDFYMHICWIVLLSQTGTSADETSNITIGESDPAVFILAQDQSANMASMGRIEDLTNGLNIDCDALPSGITSMTVRVLVKGYKVSKT